jgi:hypothetical protein
MEALLAMGWQAQTPMSRRERVLVRATLGGLGLGIILAFVWSQLLWKAWTDCQAGDAFTQTLKLVFFSPFVVASVVVAFDVPALLVGRRWPIAAAALALAFALIATYLWFAWLLNNTQSAPFHPDQLGTCPGTVPPWWPSWLPV